MDAIIISVHHMNQFLMTIPLVLASIALVYFTVQFIRLETALIKQGIVQNGLSKKLYIAFSVSTVVLPVTIAFSLFAIIFSGDLNAGFGSGLFLVFAGIPIIVFLFLISIIVSLIRKLRHVGDVVDTLFVKYVYKIISIFGLWLVIGMALENIFKFLTRDGKPIIFLISFVICIVIASLIVRFLLKPSLKVS